MNESVIATEQFIYLSRRDTGLGNVPEGWNGYTQLKPPYWEVAYPFPLKPEQVTGFQLQLTRMLLTKDHLEGVVHLKDVVKFKSENSLYAIVSQETPVRAIGLYPEASQLLVINLEPVEGLHTVKVVPAYVGNLPLKISN